MVNIEYFRNLLCLLIDSNVQSKLSVETAEDLPVIESFDISHFFPHLDKSFKKPRSPRISINERILYVVHNDRKIVNFPGESGGTIDSSEHSSRGRKKDIACL